jgi:hypothetical protein
MFKRITILTLLLSVFPSAAPAPEQSELVLKKAEQESLVKLVAKWMDAKKDRKGIEEALGKIGEQVAKLRTSKKSEPLTWVDDWSHVMALALQSELPDRIKGKGKVEEDTFDAGEHKVGFAVHAPAKYTKKESYALILIAPDLGVKPKEHIDKDWIDAAGRERAILCALEMPSDEALWSRFDPVGPLDGVNTFMFAFSHISASYNVDMNRVFLAGSGAGIGAALATAGAFPHRFAGVVGRGAAPAFDAINFRNTPTLFLNGGTHATDFETKAKELGYTTCTTNAGGTEADAWDWIASQRRTPYPSKVSLVPTSYRSDRSFWVAIDGFDPTQGPHLEAEADRATNTITISAEKISGVRLSLNDRLVNLDQPLRILVNGTTSEQKPGRNLKTLLEGVLGNADWGRVYPVYLSLDVPTKK